MYLTKVLFVFWHYMGKTAVSFQQEKIPLQDFQQSDEWLSWGFDN